MMRVPPFQGGGGALLWVWGFWQGSRVKQPSRRRGEMVFRIFLILHQTCERVRVPEFSLSEFLLSREQVAQVAGVAGFLGRVGRTAGRGEWRKAIQPMEN